MNPERKERLIEAIRSKKYVFDMSTWGTETPYGTAACIGGHCLLLMRIETVPWESSHTRVAATWLELRREEAIDLFRPSDLRDWERITDEDAITAIENVAQHGSARWKSIRPDLVEEAA